MKQLLFIVLVLFSFTATAQVNNIANSAWSDLDGNSLIGVGDYIVGYGYVTRKTNIDSLAAKMKEIGVYVPIWKTPYGNVPNSDSSAVLHGVEIYPNETKVNNTLWSKDFVFTKATESTGENRYHLGGTYRGPDRGSITISPDGNNGTVINGWSNPRPTKNGYNMAISSHVNMSSDSAKMVGNKVAAMTFRITGDTWDANGNWTGNYRVKNMPLFDFGQYYGSHLLTMWDDSIKAKQEFAVTSNDGNTDYFRVKSDEIKASFSNTTITHSNSGVMVKDLSSRNTGYLGKGTFFIKKEFANHSNVWDNPYLVVSNANSNGNFLSNGDRLGRITLQEDGRATVFLGGTVSDSANMVAQFEIYNSGADYVAKTPSLIVNNSETDVNNTLKVNKGLVLQVYTTAQLQEPTFRSDLPDRFECYWDSNDDGYWDSRVAYRKFDDKFYEVSTTVISNL